MFYIFPYFRDKDWESVLKRLYSLLVTLDSIWRLMLLLLLFQSVHSSQDHNLIQIMVIYSLDNQACYIWHMLLTLHLTYLLLVLGFKTHEPFAKSTILHTSKDRLAPGAYACNPYQILVTIFSFFFFFFYLKIRC